MIRLALCLLILALPVQADVLLSEDEIAQTLGFGPWPPGTGIRPEQSGLCQPGRHRLGRGIV